MPNAGVPTVAAVPGQTRTSGEPARATARKPREPAAEPQVTAAAGADDVSPYQTLLELLPEAVLVHSDGVLVYANRAALRLAGLPDDEPITSDAIDLHSWIDDPGDRALVTERASRLTEVGVPNTPLEIGLRRSDGRPLRVEVVSALTVWKGEQAVQTIIRDLTDRQARLEAEDRLRHVTTHDPLTELPNRSAFLDHLDGLLHRIDPAGVLAVLVVDLDKFQGINDSVGHAVGDEVLRTTGRRLSSHVRDTDVVARIGGDEFGVAALVADEAAALALAQRMLGSLARPAGGRMHGHRLRASVGVVVAGPGDARTPTDLLGDAGAAMTQAKAAGGDRAGAFDIALRQQVQRRAQLDADLREALAGSGLWVAYQPLVDLASGRWVGAEALARWNHPTLGSVPPLEFVTVAEQSDLILGLGRRTLATACRDAVSLRATDPEFSMSVNLSVRQFDDPALITHVQTILTESDLPASALCLEVTEGSFAIDEAIAVTRLEALRDLGISIAVDDFGTGYSSLARLRSLPADELKIDRSFVTTLPDDQVSRDVVAGIITLAHALEMRVVAEGVETARHAEILAELGCDLAQGYHFSRPVKLTEFSPPTVP